MAERGEIRIRFRAVGAAQLRAAMRGTATEARRANNETKRSARETERERAKLARDGAKAAQRAERERVRAARAADAEIRRSNAALHREQTRTRRAQERAAERIRQTESRNRGNERRQIAAGAAGVGMAGAAAIVAGLTASLSAISDRLSSTADAIANQSGTTDVAQRTARAQQFELNLARSSGEFFQDESPEERTAAMAALRAEIEAVGVATGQSPTDLLAGLSRAQTAYSQFSAIRTDMRAIADEATRTGASFEDTAAFVGLLNQQLGESAPTAARAFDIMAQQGLDGSLSPEQYANDFGGTIGAFGSQTGLTGEALLRTHGGLAQAMAAGGRGSSESATMLQALMSDLGNAETRARLVAATGGTVQRRRGRDGRMHATTTGGTAAFREDGTVDYEALQGDLAGMDSRALAGVFRNVEARMAAEQLGSLMRRDRAGEDVMTGIDLANVDAEAGARFRSSNLADVSETAAMRAKRAATSGEVEGMHEGGVRGDEAQRLLDYREAMRRTGGDVGVGAMIPDLIQNLVGPALLERLGNLSPSSVSALDTAGASLSASDFSFGPLALGATAGGLLSGAASMARTGNLQNRIGKEARGGASTTAGPTRVEGEVSLSARSVEQLADAMARKQARAPVPGRTPGAPGRG